MKMYLKSQYHMHGPSPHRAHRTVLCDNCTQALSKRPQLAGHSSTVTGMC